MIRVKICGIRRIEDALAAVRCGADAVGLLVGQRHASSDFLEAVQARVIARTLPPFCSSVLVTHLSSHWDIVPLAEQVGPNVIQLHGDTTPEQAMVIRDRLPNIRLVKAIHVTGRASVDEALRYDGVVHAILLDTANAATQQVGGTGLTHDWTVSRLIVERCPLPVILAGGLHADNVAAAIRAVRPFGVDANSGTKGADGYKDAARMLAFVRNAKCLAAEKP